MLMQESTKNNKTLLTGVGYGKIILLGEHAVVYGRHAIAAPIPLAMQAQIKDATEGITLTIPRWNVNAHLTYKEPEGHSFQSSLCSVLKQLGLTNRAMQIEVDANIPRASGLGGSAALAVAVIRALNQHYQLTLDDEDVNRLAFDCENIAHGAASGIDNTVATFGKVLLYKNSQPPLTREIAIRQPIKFVIAMSGIESLTAKMVAQVAKARTENPQQYNQIFDDIDCLVLDGLKALEQYDLVTLGQLMKKCHYLLSDMHLSNEALEEMIQIADSNGALGAKLTGGGGGGSIIALCPSNSHHVVSGMQAAGYQAREVEIG